MKRRQWSILLTAAFCNDLFSMTNDVPNATIVEQLSAWPFAPTLDRLVKVIEGAGMRIFARIDHAAGATEVGMMMPPTVLLIYGHPKGGTPIMLVAPQAGLDLPLRTLVREDAEGRTRVSFYPVGQTLIKAGVPEHFARRLEPAQAILLKAILP